MTRLICVFGCVLVPFLCGVVSGADEPFGEKDTITINGEVLKKADLLKGVEECCTYEAGV